MIEDFLVKVVAQLLLNFAIKLIDAGFDKDFSADVIDSIARQQAKHGPLVALLSSARVILNMRAPFSWALPQALANSSIYFSFPATVLAIVSYSSLVRGTGNQWFITVGVCICSFLTFEADSLGGVLASRLVVYFVRRESYLYARLVTIGTFAFTTSYFGWWIHLLFSAVHKSEPWGVTFISLGIVGAFASFNYSTKTRLRFCGIGWEARLAERVFASFETSAAD
jgi:hypothetical protein